MTIATESAPLAAVPIPEIERRRKQESYEELVQRLSVQSVRKHYQAYVDIDWDAPEMQIRKDDPRFELPLDGSLGATRWYRSQPQSVRAEIGLTGVVNAMKMGVVFESVLKRGLLEYAERLPNGSPEFRYAYHEVIEEAQHSLMFQELINRSGLNPGGLRGLKAFGARRVASFGRFFPELFFFFVLGGEEPIDFEQKQTLRSGQELHPLVKRVMQIHITEEARHLCFARNHLQQNVPKLGWFARLRLSIAVPFILGEMAKMMLEPSRSMIRRFAIPAVVVREAYTDNPEHKRRVRASLASVAKLCIELGLLTRRNAVVWKTLGLGNPFRYAA
jgi:P-aminobenzoate N-oxygenase AurF